MTDYVAIALQGFSTGIGVIIANEVWNVFKKYRERVKEEAKNLWRNGNEKGILDERGSQDTH
jgi:hypothetical protein